MRVLVTGAASGIGRATCVRLARDARAAGRSARVVAVDVAAPAQLDGLVAELRELGADALALHGDMGTADAPGRVLERAGLAAEFPFRYESQQDVEAAGEYGPGGITLKRVTWGKRR